MAAWIFGGMAGGGGGNGTGGAGWGDGALLASFLGGGASATCFFSGGFPSWKYHHAPINPPPISGTRRKIPPSTANVNSELPGLCVEGGAMTGGNGSGRGAPGAIGAGGAAAGFRLMAAPHIGQRTCAGKGGAKLSDFRHDGQARMTAMAVPSIDLAHFSSFFSLRLG
jgi:hypothetical protein